MALVSWLLALMPDGLVLAQPPLTQPLLIYNCAKMPAICRNVHLRNPLQAVANVPNALGLLNTGVSSYLLEPWKFASSFPLNDPR